LCNKITPSKDGVIFPPENIGALRHAVALEFKEGRLVDVSGDGPEAKIYKNWIDGFSDPNLFFFYLNFFYKRGVV
jgi:hypothetical protein